MSHLELQEFFVEGNKQRTSHVLLHITEPSTPEELEKGYFFALIELNNSTIGHIEQYQKMIDDIEVGYYETDHGNRDAFEATLELINRRSEQLLHKDSEVHALVAVIRDSTLAFAVHGQPQVYLFYRQKQDFVTMNIADGAGSDMGTELFPSVLQGKLNAGDFLFAGTPHIMHYFTADRLQKLITSRSIKQSAEHIHKVLADVSSEHSFGGIVFRMLPQSERHIPALQKKKPQGSEASLNKLVASKQQTAETLSPPVFRQLLRQMKESMAEKKHAAKKAHPISSLGEKEEKAAETPKQEERSQSEETIGNAFLIGFGRALVAGVLAVAKTIQVIAVTLAKLCIGVFILITNKNNSRKEVITAMKKSFHRGLVFIEELPLISKLLFVLTLVALIILSGSIATMRLRKEYAQKQEAYANLVSAVQNKKDAAEASIIYNDNATALALLQEARGLLDQFPKEDKKTDEQKLQFEQGIQETLRKVQKMKEVTPETIATLSGNAEKIIKIDNTLIAYGANNEKLYRINLSTKMVDEATHEAIPGLRAATTPKEQDTTIFIYNDNRIAGYQKDAHILTAKDIGYPGTNPYITDGFIYNVKLYTIDRANNQIYKHSKTQTGYDKGTPWLRSSADLSQAVSLAIDGDMFVLTGNGQILKFASGQQQAFAISGLEPALSEPTQIWTYNDVNHLYILEPKYRRVVVLDKNGALVQQYTSPSWGSPTGMVVDEAAKTVYILDQNTISSFPL